MGAIFISYRRQDTEGQAGRLFEDLSRRFGRDQVFMDVATIEPGRDFRRAIDHQVASCGVLLALVGRNWTDAVDEKGQRRLDDPTDFVRLETASALRRDIPVVPVLVQGARMPLASQLPPDLNEFAFRNAVELTHARWESDVEVLVRALLAYVGSPKGDAAAAPPAASPLPNAGGAVPATPRTALGGRIAVVAAVVAALAAVAWFVGGRGAVPVAEGEPGFRLVGRWSIVGGGPCVIDIDRDDGKDVRGLCDANSIEHHFVGHYVDADTVQVTIMRKNLDMPDPATGKPPCMLLSAGKMHIVDRGTVEFTQEGWKQGCDVKADIPAPPLVRLLRK